MPTVILCWDVAAASITLKVMVSGFEYFFLLLYTSSLNNLTILLYIYLIMIRDPEKYNKIKSMNKF